MASISISKHTDLHFGVRINNIEGHGFYMRYIAIDVACYVVEANAGQEFKVHVLDYCTFKRIGYTDKELVKLRGKKRVYCKNVPPPSSPLAPPACEASGTGSAPAQSGTARPGTDPAC